MPASQPANFNLQELTDAGLPLAGGRLYTYFTGTTTFKPAYTDPAGTVPHTYTNDGSGGQYIALNSRGELPAALCLSIGTYDLALKRADGSTVWTRSADGVDTLVTSLRSDITSVTGSGLVGHCQSNAAAVATTIAEIFSRKISVWDFMSTALRADALSGTPVLDHAPAWNAAISSLNGSGKVEVPRKGTCVYLLKTTVNLGTTNIVDSNIIIDIEAGTLIKATLATATTPLFSFKNIPGHFNNQRIKNLRAYSTNGFGVGAKFNGQCSGGLDDFSFENFGIGIMTSNAGTGVFNEFIHFNSGELHLNGVAIQMDKDGGTDVSMHGIAFNDVTMNVGSGQYGLNLININWYNANFTFRCFVYTGHLALIRMDMNTNDTGVFGSGCISCEGGPANIIGTGRFWFDGIQNFMSGVNDTSTPVNAWEQALSCNNYLKTVTFGSSGLNVAELMTKGGVGPSNNGPYGSFSRLRASNVESLIATSLGAHAANPGNGMYTGYTGYQVSYTAGTLGWFLASDGTEMKSYAPSGTLCTFRAGANGNPYGDNIAFAIKDGRFLVGGNAAVTTGSGAPNGSVVGSPGDMYLNRSGGAGTTLYIKESGTATNTGWVAK